MSEGLELVLQAIGTDGISALPLTILALFGTSMGTLLYVFLTNTRSSKLRVSLLTGLCVLKVFLWPYVAVSLVLRVF